MNDDDYAVMNASLNDIECLTYTFTDAYDRHVFLRDLQAWVNSRGRQPYAA